MKRKIVDVKGSEEFSSFFNSLSNDDPFKIEIKNAIQILKEFCTRGEKIEHDKWPNYYVQKYGINNLWRYELDQEKRMIYTIIGSTDGFIVSIIEAFVNHTDYEKRFGY